MAERLRHIVSATQFSPTDIQEFLAEAILMQAINGGHILNNKEGVLLFYRPSTRTAGSFVRAIHRLGGECFQALTPRQSMWGKEEDELDGDVDQQLRSFRNEGYCYVVLRHHQIVGAAIASEKSPLPLINAGEGFGGDQLRYLVEHPTQALGDLFTIKRLHSSLGSGFRIAFMGDVRSNPAVNSLAIVLAKLGGVELEYVAPENTDLSPRLRECLKGLKTAIRRRSTIEEVLNANIIYIANSHYSEPPNMTKLEPEHLDRLASTTFVMHDLLLGKKPDPEIENHPQMAHDQQERYWVAARMALLKMLLA